MNVLLSSKDGYLSLPLCDFFLYPQRSPAAPELVLIAIRLSSDIDERATWRGVARLSNNGDVPWHRDAKECSRQRYSDKRGMRARTLDR